MVKQILIIKHIEIEGPGTIEHFFKNTHWALTTVDLAAGDILPGSLENIAAIISLGGPMNVYEEADYPFLRWEEGFLRIAIKEEIPILGICLGAQLLAKACGAKVNKAREKEIGWYEVNLTDKGTRDPLFSALPGKLEVFQWHEDTFDIPAGAVHLAGSRLCPKQAFGFGKNAYGLQFHIEVSPHMIKDWICEYMKEGETGFDPRNMLIEAHEKKKIFERQANVIYRNFARIIEALHR